MFCFTLEDKSRETLTFTYFLFLKSQKSIKFSYIKLIFKLQLDLSKQRIKNTNYKEMERIIEDNGEALETHYPSSGIC